MQAALTDDTSEQPNFLFIAAVVLLGVAVILGFACPLCMLYCNSRRKRRVVHVEARANKAEARYDDMKSIRSISAHTSPAHSQQSLGRKSVTYSEEDDNDAPRDWVAEERFLQRDDTFSEKAVRGRAELYATDDLPRGAPANRMMNREQFKEFADAHDQQWRVPQPLHHRQPPSLIGSVRACDATPQSTASLPMQPQPMPLVARNPQYEQYYRPAPPLPPPPFSAQMLRNSASANSIASQSTTRSAPFSLPNAMGDPPADAGSLRRSSSSGRVARVAVESADVSAAVFRRV